MILFTTIDGYIGSSLYKKFAKKNEFFFLTDKISRVDISSNVYYYKDFSDLLTKQGFETIFNNRGTLMGGSKAINEINFIDSDRIFNSAIAKKVKNFINLDTNRVFNSPDIPSSIVLHGKGKDYYDSKKRFRDILNNNRSSINKINIYCDIIYGPNDKLHKFINKITNKLILKKDIVLYNPNLVRNFLFIEDFLNFIEKLIASLDKVENNYTEFHLASDEFFSIYETVMMAREALNAESLISIKNENDFVQINSLLRDEFGMSKNPNWFDWNPETDFKSGLSQVIKSLKKY